MQDLNNTSLDFFEATHLSAHHTVVDDGQHFLFEFNQYLMNNFYPPAEKSAG